MSARVDRTATGAATTSVAPPNRNSRTEEVIVNFDAEKIRAPFLLRCGALLIDYIILVLLPVLGLLTARFSTGDAGAKLFKNPLSSAGWMVAILVAVTNFIIFPMLSGQSIGKMFTGLKIIRKDGRAANFGQLLVRHLIGYPVTLLTGGLGFLLSVFNAKGRALHDLVAGTVVVYGRKTPKAIAAASQPNASVSKRSLDTQRLDESDLPANRSGN